MLTKHQILHSLLSSTPYYKCAPLHNLYRTPGLSFFFAANVVILSTKLAPSFTEANSLQLSSANLLSER
uniref:Uncharacterized protein n=1 Tax=Arundo donax TaxID=35708 RepID=A0A0A9HP67_ARUDO